MEILGIDFTSRPRRGKPISCARCQLTDDILHFEELIEWSDFEEFESALVRPGPWIAGIDFPFGQSRRFIENVGWPKDWSEYVRHSHLLKRDGFRSALENYRKPRPKGDKEHRRQTDIAAGSISPQKLYGVPVGLMFFEGAPRLLAAGVTVPHLLSGDPARIVVEAYPGVLARSVIGRTSYKNDTRKKQTTDQRDARYELLKALHKGVAQKRYGFGLEAPDCLCDDPCGDHLDAFLCAIQAGWAWHNRMKAFGALLPIDNLEGWIADPLTDPALRVN